MTDQEPITKKTIFFLRRSSKTADLIKNPLTSFFLVIAVFFLSQIIGSLVISIYPVIKGWTSLQANNWLNNSVLAQFFYVLIAESINLAAIYIYFKLRKIKFSVIGLRKPKISDIYYSLIVVPIYYGSYFLIITLVTSLYSGFNVNQSQQIGFNNVHGTTQLTLTFISLVILPPITEEIMLRGVIYSSLKSKLPTFFAVILTSLLFASAHLPEGGKSGLFWIGAVDTFTLSLVLIYLREKTNGIYSSIILHAFKNGVAFYFLFLSTGVR